MVKNTKNELNPFPTLLLKPEDAAKALAISPRKLWAMTASGEIPHLRLGGSIRYSPDCLQQWISNQNSSVK